MREISHYETGTAGGFGSDASRVLAFVLGGFALLNVLGGWVRPGFDANLWWIDLRPLPGFLAAPFLAAAGVCLLGCALQWRLSERRVRVAGGVAAVLLVASLANAAVFYGLLLTGAIRTSMPIPFSLLVAGALWLILRSLRLQPSPSRRAGRRPFRRAAAVAAVLIAAALAQMYCFGKTDYRRQADAIVVFGAGVRPDGRCSDALADRMRTAILLYRQGYADRLIFSGGPGMGAVHETEAMRRMALAGGVPDRAIALDPAGLNTRATVKNTAAMFDRFACRRVLAVSHFYHLPRIKMAYQRAGRQVYTVPAEESYTLTAMPYYLARETAALWAYYLQP